MGYYIARTTGEYDIHNEEEKSIALRRIALCENMLKHIAKYYKKKEYEEEYKNTFPNIAYTMLYPIERLRGYLAIDVGDKESSIRNLLDFLGCSGLDGRSMHVMDSLCTKHLERKHYSHANVCLYTHDTSGHIFRENIDCEQPSSNLAEVDYTVLNETLKVVKKIVLSVFGITNKDYKEYCDSNIADVCVERIGASLKYAGDIYMELMYGDHIHSAIEGADEALRELKIRENINLYSNDLDQRGRQVIRERNESQLYYNGKSYVALDACPYEWARLENGNIDAENQVLRHQFIKYKQRQ